MDEMGPDMKVVAASDEPVTVELDDDALNEMSGGASVGFPTGNLSRLNGG